jgi:hypothetical protein
MLLNERAVVFAFLRRIHVCDIKNLRHYLTPTEPRRVLRGSPTEEKGAYMGLLSALQLVFFIQVPHSLKLKVESRLSGQVFYHKLWLH